MSNPKRKYATIDQGMNFRAISAELEKLGYTLGPSRVRTIMIKILFSIAKEISKKTNREISNEKIMAIVKDVEFQNKIAPFIEDVYSAQHA